MTKKYYVVRVGHQAGIYDSWPEAQEQVNGYKGAKYQSFPQLQQAQRAYQEGYTGVKGKMSHSHLRDLLGEDFDKSIATDAACPRNPGPIEYRGVEISTNKEIFNVGPIAGGSTNIAEFLAIVQGLSRIRDNNTHHTILYSDSTIAIGRVEKNNINTTIAENDNNTELWHALRKAQERFSSHPDWHHTITLKKRPTRLWGQIPADFGRK